MNKRAVLTAIVALAMTMLPSLPAAHATVTTTSAPTATTLFSDDFSGDLSRWSVVTGAWSIQSGELLGRGFGGNIDAWIYAGDTSWTDYALQTKVVFVDCNAELVLRSTGHWQNEYRVELWQDTPGCAYRNSYDVMKYKNGVVTVFTRGLPGAVDGNAPSPVPITNPLIARVEVIGNTIAVYVNNQLVNRFTDPDPLPSGRIGLGVIWDLSTRFDDVTVTALPRTILVHTFFVDVSARVADTTYPLGRAIELHDLFIQEGQPLPAGTVSWSGPVDGTTFTAALTLAATSFEPLILTLQRFQISLPSGQSADISNIATATINVPGMTSGSVTVTQSVAGIGDVAFTFSGQAQTIGPAVGTIEFSPASRSIPAGASTVYALSIPSLSGSDVFPTWRVVSDLPQGATAEFFVRAAPWVEQLVIRTSCATPKGQYQVVVEASGTDGDFIGIAEVRILDPLVESSPGIYSTSLAQGTVVVLRGGPSTFESGLFLNLQFCDTSQKRKLSVTVQSVKSATGAALPSRTPDLLESRVGPASAGQGFNTNPVFSFNAVDVGPTSSNGIDHIEWSLQNGQYFLFLGQSPLDTREPPGYVEYQVEIIPE